ncbi:MAG: MoxR family ATPase [Methylobacter sp.]|nr:MoxR family ATPase [Methylobacter sp.]
MEKSESTEEAQKAPEWCIYRGEKPISDLPPPPSWRNFSAKKQNKENQQKNDRGSCYIPNHQDIELVNAALYLRRPLLVEGKAGTGKTSLAYSVEHELKLGGVLRWSITTRTTLKDGLYQYDAIGRLQDKSLHGDKSPEINEYLRLGALGTAFANDSNKPRVLLIDEIDKSDIDLPNDLLHIFEEGEFEIPELKRLKGKHEIFPSDDGTAITIENGRVLCKQFPLVIMTSNGEREFPPAFLRRCLRLEIQQPDKDKLQRIVEAHFHTDTNYVQYKQQIDNLIDEFIKKINSSDKTDLANDQLLNTVHLTLRNINLSDDKESLLESLWKSLSNS